MDSQNSSVDKALFTIEQLKRLVDFLQSYSYLHEFINIKYFVWDIWKKIPAEWFQYLSQLTNSQLNSFPFEEPIPSECPADLRHFVNESRQCSLLSYIGLDNGIAYNEEDSAKKFKQNCRITAKKQHELKRFVEVISSHCHSNHVNRIVDVGCGIGHLLNTLSFTFQVVGIECDEMLCKSGTKRYASVKYENLALKDDDVNRQCLFSIFCGQQTDRTAIVSLHGCGDLQPNLLRWFIQLPNDRCPLLFTVGCCYHKMSCVGKPVREWALSESLRSICSAEWILEAGALRLACQEQLSRWPTNSEQQHEAHLNAFLQRALLECVYENRDLKKAQRYPRRLNRSFRHLESVGEELAQRLGLNENERDELVNEYGRVYRHYQNRFSTVESFTMLQAMMQMPLESLILVDRYFYLMESGYKACLKPVFDSRISPRNMCLIAGTKTLDE